MSTLREIHWAVFHGELPLHMAVELSAAGELERLWTAATDDVVNLMTELVVETGGLLPPSLGLDLAQAASEIIDLASPEVWHALLAQGRRTAQSRRRTQEFNVTHHDVAMESESVDAMTPAWSAWQAIETSLNAVNDMLNHEGPFEINNSVADAAYFARNSLEALYHPELVRVPGVRPPVPDPALNGTALARLVIAATRAPTLEQLLAAASANVTDNGRDIP
jgi:hypothetical protein